MSDRWNYFRKWGVLQTVHVEGWRKGNEHYRVLQPWIQIGPEKFQKAIRHFTDWVKHRGLRPIEAAHTRRGAGGLEVLRVTEDGNPEWEKFFHTYYTAAEKTARLAAKLNKPPDLVAFQKVGDEGNCAECGAELLAGSFLLMEKGQPLCLTCADLDQLVFLPAGDMALSRRARKHSSLAAVVVRFNRARKRYERQGLLVTEEALAKAETECAADAPARAADRSRALEARQEEDRAFVGDLTQAILRQYPGCPASSGRQIAEHAGLRSSGRVGRSAAGRALDASAVKLAVIAHVRHEHTNYDQLLMGGAARLDARAIVREKIDRVLVEWSGG